MLQQIKSLAELREKETDNTVFVFSQKHVYHLGEVAQVGDNTLVYVIDGNNIVTPHLFTCILCYYAT